MVEKQLATDRAAALHLVTAAEEAGRLLVVGQNYRHNEPFRAVQRGAAGCKTGEATETERQAT